MSHGIPGRFTYHPPLTEERARQHQSVRALCMALADSLVTLVPDGRELALTLTNLEQVMFWANAGIARHPDNGGQPETDPRTCETECGEVPPPGGR